MSARGFSPSSGNVGLSVSPLCCRLLTVVLIITVTAAFVCHLFVVSSSSSACSVVIVVFVCHVLAVRTLSSSCSRLSPLCITSTDVSVHLFASGCLSYDVRACECVCVCV